MKILLNLDFSNGTTAIINILIILFLISGIITGFKRGFLESSVRFIGTIVALVGAFILKNPVSVFMYKNLPFFKFGGSFQGVSALNILLYECIAFFFVFGILMLVIDLVCKLTGIIDRIFSFILLLGIPNKILGAAVGLIEHFIILYFLCYVLTLGCSVFNFALQPSLIDDIVEAPILKKTFSPALNSLNDIVSLSDQYTTASRKDEYNYNALSILLKYDVISCDNAKDLIKSGKISIENSDDLLKGCKK